MKNIIEEIIAEKERQEKKFPGQWDKIDMITAYPILAEEVGEVAREINDVLTLKTKDGLEDMRKELIQVATCAIRMIGIIDRDKE